MNVWRLNITWRRKHNGRYELPWDILTKESLSPEARALIAKVARSECKNYLQECAEKVAD